MGFNNDNTLQLLYGKLRRFLLALFRKEQIQVGLSNREGECNQCAKCCELVFRCPFLSKENLCKIYNSGVRPATCGYFPIDPRDLADVRLSSEVECSYWFKPLPEIVVSNPEALDRQEGC